MSDGASTTAESRGRGEVVTAATQAPAILTVRGLEKQFGPRRSIVDRVRRRQPRRLRAVADVSLDVPAGQTLAVVGETGSGKSTLGRLIVRLEQPTAGDIEFRGTSVRGVDRRTSMGLRREIQIILQDPYSTLNPYRTVAQTVGEVVRVHRTAPGTDRDAEVDRLLEMVGFPLAMRDRLPGELSGGGRQRVSIARALAVGPSVIVADEPVSALDVSVQAQVLTLFERLRDELGLTYVFITHDLAVVRRLADRVAVMYLGRVVEEGPVGAIESEPLHPYTAALLAAAPDLRERRGSTQPALRGDMPNAIDPPAGCVFHTRCPAVMDICRTEVPLDTTPALGRRVACHLHPGPTPSPEPSTTQGAPTS